MKFPCPTCQSPAIRLRSRMLNYTRDYACPTGHRFSTIEKPTRKGRPANGHWGFDKIQVGETKFLENNPPNPRFEKNITAYADYWRYKHARRFILRFTPTGCHVTRIPD
jgi:hypothetical protein